MPKFLLPPVTERIPASILTYFRHRGIKLEAVRTREYYDTKYMPNRVTVTLYVSYDGIEADYTGQANCHPDDFYEFEIGEKLALMRALLLIIEHVK